jgi:hypothetical protein
MTMADVTLDKVIQDAVALPPEEQHRLIEFLTDREAQTHPRKTIEQIAAQHGKSPLDFGEIRKLGLFFPEDESVDDLVRVVRSLRNDRSERTLG